MPFWNSAPSAALPSRPGIRRAVPCSAELWYAAGPQSLTLYFHCAPVGTKLDLLRADPNVSFEADCPGTVSGGATSCTYGMNYQSVIGRGTVRFVEGGEKLTALQALMQHYHCPDLPFEPEMVEHTTVLALDVPP